jgi:hypothetical protein
LWAGRIANLLAKVCVDCCKRVSSGTSSAAMAMLTRMVLVSMLQTA